MRNAVSGQQPRRWDSIDLTKCMLVGGKTECSTAIGNRVPSVSLVTFQSGYMMQALDLLSPCLVKEAIGSGPERDEGKLQGNHMVDRKVRAASTQKRQVRAKGSSCLTSMPYAACPL